MEDKPKREAGTSGASIAHSSIRLEAIVGPATLNNTQQKQPARPGEEAYKNADALFKVRGYSGAASAYKLAVGIYKNPSEKSYDHYAFALFKLGKNQEAETVLREAVRKYPKDVQLVRNLGNICQRNGKLEQAVTYYEKALELDSTDEELRLHLDKLKSKMTKPQE